MGPRRRPSPFSLAFGGWLIALLILLPIAAPRCTGIQALRRGLPLAAALAVLGMGAVAPQYIGARSTPAPRISR